MPMKGNKALEYAQIVNGKPYVITTRADIEITETNKLVYNDIDLFIHSSIDENNDKKYNKIIAFEKA